MDFSALISGIRGIQKRKHIFKEMLFLFSMSTQLCKQKNKLNKIPWLITCVLMD